MGGSNYTTAAPEPSTEPEPTMSEDEIVKIQFYKTYDVMTGVRIAATLGGFFSLMVLLVIYKSKCKSRSLSDENLEAAVAAAVVEEEKLELAFGKRFSLYLGGRRSLGNMSAPVSHTRFSSVGGGYSIFAPPVRLGYSPRARVSLPTSSPYIYPSPFLPRTLLVDNPAPTPYKEDDEEDDIADAYLVGPTNFLRVPSSRRSSRSSRRLSSITCSSCDTSYLERRGSAMEMGRPIPPPIIGSRRDRLDEEPWDFYYPIDIQVIQPTPEISPCESQNSLYNCPTPPKDGLHVPRVAPLASISSCGLPSIEHDNHSEVGSDSVFLDEELVDTEDEVEEFSTDSDAENIECDIPSIDSKLIKKGSKKFTGNTKDNRVPIRRFSTPTPSIHRGDNQSKDLENIEDNTCPSTSKTIQERKSSTLKTSSDSDTIHVSAGVEEQTCEKSDKSIFVPRAYMSVSCDQLVKILQEHSSEAEGNKTIVEHCTWSQETLF